MKNFEFDWQSASDKQTLKGECWLPENKPKAIVCLIHGFGGHIKRYKHVAQNFVQHDIGLIGFDLIGHGRSDGKRGLVKNYDLFMTHIAEFLSLIKEKFQGFPLFLYGHSMGGNLVASFTLNYKPEVTGTIITSPWLKLTKEPPKIQVVIGALIGSWFPKFTTPVKLDINDLSNDTKVRQAYPMDSLVHNRMSAALFISITDAGERIIKEAVNFTAPILWMHGEQDKITSHLASKEVASKNDKIEFILWEGLKHELHNEIKKEEVLKKIVSWMKSCL